jgi:hypothetical protein
MNEELEGYASVLTERLLESNTCPFAIAYAVKELAFVKNKFFTPPTARFIHWFNWVDTPQGVTFWAKVCYATGGALIDHKELRDSNKRLEDGQ